MTFKLKKTCLGAAIAGVLAAGAAATPATASAEPFVGEIMMVGYQFCPAGTMEADGRLLPIAEYTALFSLYGTTFGGDGRTTFGLPDLMTTAKVDQPGIRYCVAIYGIYPSRA